MFEESRINRKPKPVEPALITVTGEFYQPVRIYYEVDKKNAVLGRFKRLRCLNYDEPNNRWVWFYKEEAKDIEFKKSYRYIPKEERPVVLGYFSWKGDRELHLDVGSFAQVVEAIKFFDQKINRRLAKVARMRVVNKFFPATTTKEEMSGHHVLFFEQSEVVDHKADMAKMDEIASQFEEGEERQKAAFAYMEQQMRKKLPEVEELEINFYEDGIESVLLVLRMRLLEATEHWKGNKNYSQFDVMEQLMEQFGDEDF